MCSVSMVMDHTYDEWWRRYYDDHPTLVPQPTAPYTVPIYPQPVRLPTQEEVDDFRRLLERARQYDKDHGQPDCELEDKRRKIKDLAEQLGVDVSFV